MSQHLEIEGSDAFFNMRGRFWEESRDRALAEIDQLKPLIRKIQEKQELNPDKEIEERIVTPAPARAVGGA